MGNIQLLQATLDLLKSQPEMHDQSEWIGFRGFFDTAEAVESTPNMCHTTMCTAGHAAAIAGAEVPTLKHYYYNGWRLHPDGKLALKGSGGQGVAVWAADALGVNPEEADYIFYCDDDEMVIKRIEQVIELWKNGEEFSYDWSDPIYDEDRHDCECCG